LKLSVLDGVEPETGVAEMIQSTVCEAPAPVAQPCPIRWMLGLDCTGVPDVAAVAFCRIRPSAAGDAVDPIEFGEWVPSAGLVIVAVARRVTVLLLPEATWMTLLEPVGSWIDRLLARR
jgi:hypothetical protein